MRWETWRILWRLIMLKTIYYIISRSTLFKLWTSWTSLFTLTSFVFTRFDELWKKLFWLAQTCAIRDRHDKELTRNTRVLIYLHTFPWRHTIYWNDTSCSALLYITICVFVRLDDFFSGNCLTVFVNYFSINITLRVIFLFFWRILLQRNIWMHSLEIQLLIYSKGLG